MRYVLFVLFLASFGFAGSAHASPVSYDFGHGTDEKYDAWTDKDDKGKSGKSSFSWDDHGDHNWGDDDGGKGRDKDGKGRGDDKGGDNKDWDDHDRDGKGKGGWNNCDPGNPTPLPGSLLMFGPVVLGMAAFAMQRRYKLGKTKHRQGQNL